MFAVVRALCELSDRRPASLVDLDTVANADGNAGLLPHKVAGIGHCDRNTFNGTERAFKAAWPLSP